MDFDATANLLQQGNRQLPSQVLAKFLEAFQDCETAAWSDLQQLIGK
jgi:hypothetical protein